MNSMFHVLEGAGRRASCVTLPFSGDDCAAASFYIAHSCSAAVAFCVVRLCVCAGVLRFLKTPVKSACSLLCRA